MRRRTTQIVLSVLTVAALATVSACTTSSEGGDPSDSGSPVEGGGDTATAVLDPGTLAADAQGVVQKTPKPLQADRLAHGLVPPTNKWFSSLALGPEALPVFPAPLSFTEQKTGFGFGVPKVTPSDKAIIGGAASDVTVTVPGVQSTVVSAYDDLTVTLEQRGSDGKALGHTVLAQGSPGVTFTATDAVTLSQNVSFVAGEPPTVTVAGRTYGLLLDKATASGTGISLEAGGRVTWFAVPDGGSAATMASAVAPVTAGRVGYAVGSGSATTTLTYSHEGGGDGVIVAMPHQKAALAGGTTCDLGTFPSVYGTLSVCRGDMLRWSAPVRDVTTALDLSKLGDADKATLADQVRKDVAETKAYPADTYFGGKALYRSAQLYQLATQLGLEDVATSVKAKLVEQLDQWTDPQGCAKRPAFCFVYDPSGKGLVGMTPSFGSDEYNDHHFHYGYFLYTAGLLAGSDPALAAKWKPVMDLVAADIASTGTKGLFPDRRVFDAYASHSWASGTSPFGDGNNQESTSEAVTAWTGLSIWADATKNQPLRAEATWMLAGEQSTALLYGLQLDTSDPAYHGFGHQVVSLNWGGKRDYATWFSASPAAMLAILVLPASPSSAAYLGGDPEKDADRIRKQVAEAAGGAGYAQQFGDYLLMYAGLAGQEDAAAALKEASRLDAKWVDDGNSRSYLLAWLMART
jgi:endoglucanase Acf2